MISACKKEKRREMLLKYEKGQPFKDWLLEALSLAYMEARKGKRGKQDEHIFELNWVENLLNLRDEIIGRFYKPTPGIAFINYDPVMREIFAAPFRDRVVHHFLYNVSYDWWDKHLVFDSSSCREGKGTLFAIQRLMHHERSVLQAERGGAYIIKLDIKGYFMSLPRYKLFERVVWGLKQQFPEGGALFNTCKYLWREVIFDDPTQGVKKRGWPNNWVGLPKDKSLFFQPPGRGIVIGNLTSQLMSNIYLDQLDRFITIRLGYKHYGRYVDDFYIIVSGEEYKNAKQNIARIETYLRDELELRLHPKKRYYQDVRKGTNFLGARVFPTYAIPGERLAKNFRQTVINYHKGEKEADSIISYLGLMQHLKSEKLIRRVLGNTDLEAFRDKNCRNGPSGQGNERKARCCDPSCSGRSRCCC